jgi:hypothetical protein
MGTAVFWGMLIATLLGVFIIPGNFTFIQGFSFRRKRKTDISAEPPPEDGGNGGGVEVPVIPVHSGPRDGDGAPEVIREPAMTSESIVKGDGPERSEV